jgi:extracellular elastinolytic metalloproteinase
MHSKLLFLLVSLLVDARATATAPASTNVKVQLPFYYPQVFEETILEESRSLLFKRSASPVGNDLESGRQAIMSRLGISQDDFVITQSHKDKAGVMHIYASEILNGILVDNHNAAIHIKDGNVLSFSSSFTSSQSKLQKRSINVAEPNPPITLEKAVKIAVAEYSTPRDTFPAKLVYVAIENGNLVLAHQFQLLDDDKNQWYQVSVDANTGKIIQTIDYYKKFSIKAIPLPKSSPEEGFEIMTQPWDLTASPLGWNDDGTYKYTDTQGNNVYSAMRRTTNGGKNLDFTNFKWKEQRKPRAWDNKRAAIINSFYVANMCHDISYQYGFDEASGNFQTNK